MKITTTLALIALTFAPSLASAQCGSKSASMSCAAGTVFDDKAKACVPVSG